jgi:hypothetical protein
MGTTRCGAVPRLRRIAMRAGIATLANLILITAMTGCATSAPPPAAPKPAVAPVSFDGIYQGTILVTTSAAKGAQSNWCDTPPAISLSLQNGAFSYILAHPNVPQDSSYSLSPTFTVSVAPDGSFDSTSQNGEAEMIGGITGSHMEGKINGTGCAYAFTADRS